MLTHSLNEGHDQIYKLLNTSAYRGIV